VLALGNFDGLHRGHAKIIDRVRRRAGERGGTPAGDDLRSASAARRPPRQGAAAADDDEQRIEALGRAGMQGVAVVRFTHEMSQWDPETFVRLGARRVAGTWPRSGSGATSSSATIARHLLGLRTLGARYGFRAEKIDRSVTRTSSSAARASAGMVQEGRVDEAGALLGHHYFIDGTSSWRRARARDRFPHGEPADRQRAAAAGGVYATTAALGGIEHPVVTNIGTADLRRVHAPRRDAPARRRGHLYDRASPSRSCSAPDERKIPERGRAPPRRSRRTAGRPPACSGIFSL
jgi:riboflavin kinase/FMN adenylyltransferase